MTEYDDTNRGVLFKNDRKETERQPDYTGKLDVDGVEKRLAGWIRQSKTGMTFLSISVSDPMPPQEQNDAPVPVKADALNNDAIPF